MPCEPTGGLFPLFPKSGNVNAQQQNAALCHKRKYAVQQNHCYSIASSVYAACLFC